MSEVLATFRELKGIGPATEARLHEAGVLSWAALADVLAVLYQVQGRGSGSATVRELAGLAAARAAQVGGGDAPHLPAGERSEAFVIRIALDDADGQPGRCSATHVRTQTEQQWAGWHPDELVAFVEDLAGLSRVAALSGSSDSSNSSDSRGSDVSGSSRPRRSDRRVARSQEPGAPEQLVVLDAGLVIGGHRRDIELEIGDTRSVGTDFSYRATLAAHPLGASGWAELARQDGQVHPPDQLPLRFGQVELAPGVHRLQVQLAIQGAAPLRKAPKLVLAS
jgi:hypothetical protein